MGKIILSDEDYEYLAKGLALGCGLGIFLGLFINNIILTFSLCSIIGMMLSFIYSSYRKIKNNMNKKAYK